MRVADTPLLVVGGTGRLASSLRRIWPTVLPGGLRPVWQARRVASGFVLWDVLTSPCPQFGVGGMILCLAGVTRGDASALALNVDLAMAACQAAADQGARHVFLASSAAVYGPSDHPLDERAATDPPTAYGQAKLVMERAALAWQRPAGLGLTILRIGNVAGADSLLGAMRPGIPVVLDPVAGTNQGPVRSYIGPTTLSAVLARLAGMAAVGKPLPEVLNVAATAPVSMAALLDAAGQDWRFGAPRVGVIPCVVLNTKKLLAMCPLPPAAGLPDVMVAQWRGGPC